MSFRQVDLNDAPVVRYLNPTELARKLGLTVPTTLRWARTIEGFPTRHHRGFAEHEIDQWVVRCRIDPAPLTPGGEAA